MSNRARVLLVHKKDAFQQYVLERRDPHLRALLKRGQPEVRDLRRSHDIHQRAIEAVLAELKRAGVSVDMAARADLHVTQRYGLIVCVGGDGTFLQAARSIPDTPILGVNSNPERSEAVFSAARVETFAAFLTKALAGKLPELRLPRLKLRLNGRELPHRVVNDVLLAHDNPATMSRYRLRVGGREEFQKSSGIWVATAAGSGSAMLAAGGRKLGWDAARFQYQPRELYRGRLSRHTLAGGVLPSGAGIGLVWLTRRGHIYVDGPHVAIPLRFADEVRIGLSKDRPVRVLGLAASRSGRRIALSP